MPKFEPKIDLAFGGLHARLRLELVAGRDSNGKLPDTEAELAVLREKTREIREEATREKKLRLAAEEKIQRLSSASWERQTSDRAPDRVARGTTSIFLVSFCNIKDREKPCLAVVTADGDIRWLESSAGLAPAGATGLAFWRGLVCVCVQGGTNRSRFVLLNRKRDFARARGPVGEGAPLPAGPHSVDSDGEDLYFAMTGVSSIYRASYDESERRWKTSQAWTMPGAAGNRDENHLNALTFVGGDPYVSAFHHRQVDDWSTADEGVIYDVKRGRYVIKNLKQPHSLLARDRTLWTCDSRGNRLLSDQGDEIAFPSTYLRGLFFDDSYVYAASSKLRKFSMSQGATPRQRRTYEGTCAIYRAAVLAEGGWGKLEMLADFSEQRDEIYDLLPLR